MQNGEIILYQPDNSVQLEVRMEGDTVWLTQAQMSELFQKDQSVIARHIRNIFNEKELNEQSNMQIIHNTLSKYKPTGVYSLDVIISVGYRVKSQRGTQFRIWANKVLKDYIMKGYAVNQRFERLEDDVHYLKQKSKEFDLIVKTSLPPREGLFFDGQIFDAFDFVKRLIISAKKSIILIDNYIDESVLTMMADKGKGVKARIYTKSVPAPLKLAAAKFNAQYGDLIIKSFTLSHDRFLILDDKEIYLIGASLKDLGKKWLAVSELDSANIPAILHRLP